ncbi:PAQR family membrane homeostasis protein TrhA [Treponema sp.]|uniref:PAQR family membrane homeostasis protein TrhA n=1 Tax=Treponema sp. TaxID=166 RepID=UPI003F053A85
MNKISSQYKIKQYTTAEEIGNAISHGIGALLSCAALPLLIVNVVRSAEKGSCAAGVVGVSICGAAMIILYAMSTLYHSLTPAAAKKVFGILDHCSIYILIAGTYTPYCIAALGGTLGWTLFGIEWGIAAAGCTFYSIFGSRIRLLSAATYLPMAWAIVFAWKRLVQVLPESSVFFLIAGGIFYTVGFVFYALKSIRWMHTVFHFFCLAGTVCHFFSLWFMGAAAN